MNLTSLQEKFVSEILQSNSKEEDSSIVIRKDRCHEILKFLREDPDFHFEMLVDLCGVDYLPMGEKHRFEVVYHLYSLTQNCRLRVRVKVSEEDMAVPTVVDLWKGADWFEREAWEMFGFQFTGHPNLKHLLLYNGFEGYPLRKDYPIGKRQKIPIPEEIP